MKYCFNCKNKSNLPHLEIKNSNDNSILYLCYNCSDNKNLSEYNIIDKCDICNKNPTKYMAFRIKICNICAKCIITIRV